MADGDGRLSSLRTWLFRDAYAYAIEDGAQLFDGLCRQLVRVGVPLARAAIQLDDLHPLYYGHCYHWYQDGGPAFELPRSFEFFASEEFRRSPYQASRDAGGWFRCRLDDGSSTDLPLLHRLRNEGYTDFASLLIPSTAILPPGASFATKRPGGFVSVDLDLLRALTLYLGPPFELRSQRDKTTAVLQTYLGAGPAREVVEGRVKRGDVRRIEAVVLLADLRGFSAKATAWAESELLGALGGYFEIVVDAVRGADGEVLKFLGDGIPATFPIETDDAAPRCQDALAAAAEVRRGLAVLNDARAARDATPLETVVALHAGHLAYGNIGARERLDFTVIGPAVNVVSRLEARAKELGEPVLLTGTVAQRLAPDLTRSLGHHALRGMGEEIELFRPA